MCQLKAVLEQENGSQEIVMESVTGVDVTTDGVILSTFFEEPLRLNRVRIQKIDFLSGSILLLADNDNNKHDK